MIAGGEARSGGPADTTGQGNENQVRAPEAARRTRRIQMEGPTAGGELDAGIGAADP